MQISEANANLTISSPEKKSFIVKVLEAPLQAIRMLGKIFSDWFSSIKIAFSGVHHIGTNASYDQSIGQCMNCCLACYEGLFAPPSPGGLVWQLNR